MNKPYTFVEALADMDRIMREHPWWKRRIDGTPLANDLPVRAAVLMIEKMHERRLTLCEDCPPMGYPTDKTRCTECPRREGNPCLASLASNEPCKPDAENLRRCTICGFVVDLTYIAEKPP